MTTTYGHSAYCAAKVALLRCPPRGQIGSRRTHARSPQPNPVHLLPCNRPAGQLEPAPRTSLSGPETEAHWDGFWGADERYYARCTEANGREYWYRVADDIPVGRKRRETRIIPLRPRGEQGRVLDVVSRRLVVFGSSRGGRTILVGRSRRRRSDAPLTDARDR
jgi:hypothetical protein